MSKDRNHHGQVVTRGSHETSPATVGNRKRVTDHAIVRYMERIHGISREQLELEITGCSRIPRRLPSGIQPVVRGDGGVHYVKIVNDCIVTVYMHKPKNRR